ncbi:required for excision 1-B domain-containing protein-like [Oratosquilla oratoria]|uniref:required for excision 1-B domain-containing protein-like n=1 Tax=Oratosquilla oratoria TaxID=337810 RepID=UPI003F774A50
MEAGCTYALVKNFEQLQEERVHTYRLFEEGHKIYLASQPNYEFPKFRKLVHDVTEEFKRISEGIISIEKELRTSGNVAVADIVAHIQEYEKRKLELTAHLQLAKQMLQENEGDLEQYKEREIRKELSEVIEGINDQLSELKYAIAE